MLLYRINFDRVTAVEWRGPEGECNECILSSPCSFIGNDCSREIFVRRLPSFLSPSSPTARDPVLFIIPIARNANWISWRNEVYSCIFVENQVNYMRVNTHAHDVEFSLTPGVSIRLRLVVYFSLFLFLSRDTDYDDFELSEESRYVHCFS